MAFLGVRFTPILNVRETSLGVIECVRRRFEGPELEARRRLRICFCGVFGVGVLTSKLENLQK